MAKAALVGTFTPVRSPTRTVAARSHPTPHTAHRAPSPLHRPAPIVLLAAVAALALTSPLLRQAPPSAAAQQAAGAPRNQAECKDRPADQDPAAPAIAVTTAMPLPLPPPATTPRDGYIAYPDGTWFPPVNGVQHAPPIVFHDRTPFARVVAQTRDAGGRVWYLHENGTRSTTIFDGKGNAMGLVARPAPVLPMAPDDATTAGNK